MMDLRRCEGVPAIPQDEGWIPVFAGNADLKVRFVRGRWLSRV